LLLCAAGVTDQVCLLPFHGVDPDARASALDGWRDGEPEPLTVLLLDECARAARQRRLAIRRELKALDLDDVVLAPLGRAAIGARRALAVLRESLASSVPQLSVALDCSRPAAGDALERLVDVGLAVEITGRQRDRVFACARAMAALA
jgi:ribosome modulation factor